MAGLSGLITTAQSLFGAKGSDSSVNGSSDFFNILNKNWTFSRDFFIENIKLNNSSSFESIKKAYDRDNKKCPFEDFKAFEEVLKLSILGIDTSDYTFEPIQEFIGGTWYYTTGRPNMKKFTIEIRDYGEGTLYSMFIASMIALRNKFPDDQKWVIKIGLGDTTRQNLKSATTSSINGLINKTSAQVGKFLALEVESGINSVFGLAKKNTPFPGVGSLSENINSAFSNNSIASGVKNSAGNSDAVIRQAISTKSAILDSVSSLRLNHQGTDEILTFSVTFIYYNQ